MDESSNSKLSDEEVRKNIIRIKYPNDVQIFYSDVECRVGELLTQIVNHYDSYNLLNLC